MNREQSQERQRLAELVGRLEAQLADLRARLPAHSIPPGMMLELDELEDDLAVARSRLQALQEALEEQA